MKTPLLSSTATPAWCPKCATFHSDPHMLCRNCGAAMSNTRTSASQQLSESIGPAVALIFLGGIAWLLSFILQGWMVIALLAVGILAIFGGTSRTVPIKAKQDAQIFCAQCQTRGNVRTEKVRVKKGISGGKATGAILTGGLSLLAVGLSRKEDATEAKCSNCGSVWYF